MPRDAAHPLRAGVSVSAFASGRFGFVDHAPELKSLGIDCLLDRSAREVVRRSVIRTDRAGGGPGTMALRELAAREVAREGPQTSPCFRLENVNSHDLTLSAVDDGRQTCRRRRGPRSQTGYLLFARPTAATPIATVTLLMIAGGSATGLSANGACIVRVLWPMMA